MKELNRIYLIKTSQLSSANKMIRSWCGMNQIFRAIKSGFVKRKMSMTYNERE